MKIQNLFIVLGVVLVFISCQSSNESSSLQELKKELAAVSNSYYDVLKTVNVDSVTAFWTDDLQIYNTASGEIFGKEALRELLEKLYPGVEIPEVRIISRDLDVSEHLAVEVVEYSEILIKNGGEPQNIKGKGLMVWKKIEDEWKINKLIGLSSGEDENHNN
jgi:ketosteroid isomerase-like protein